MRGGARSALSVLALAALAACGSTEVQARVVYPATVPVRTFPRIWVAGGHLDFEVAAVRAIVEHLRTGGGAPAGARPDVQIVELDALEPLRRAGRIGPATVVMIVEVELREGSRPEWSSRPETVCGPAGCREASRMYDVPILDARLRLTVYEGPTARVLQRAAARSRQEGRDSDTMRADALRDLMTKVRALLDQRVENVDVALLHVDAPEVERAIESIEAGKWREGRVMLERVARGPTFRALSREERARVLYDLSQARRFDPTTIARGARHFDAAESALRAAIRIDDRPRYREALRVLAAHRAQMELVRTQREAAEHNYALERGREAGVPPPPASYAQ